MSINVEYLNPYKKWCGNIKVRGKGKFQASCPLHTDKKPSLSISRKENGNGYVHFCHSCGDKGDSATVAKLVGMDNYRDYFENPVRISTKLPNLTTF